MNDEKDYMQCIGVSSQVDRRKKTHVTFLDCEMNKTKYNGVKQFKKQVKQTAEDYFKVYIILKSSEEGIHVINPVVRHKDDVFELKSQIKVDDHMHTAIGYKRDSWVLRLSEKGTKPKPSIIGYNFYHHALKNNLYSYSHLKYLYDLYPVLRTSIRSFIGKLDLNNLVNKNLRLEKYFTY